MPDATEAVERERKFEAPDLIKIPDVPGTSVLERSHVKLTATYWDTVFGACSVGAHTSVSPRIRWIGTTLDAQARAPGAKAGRAPTCRGPRRPARPEYPPSLLRRYARAFVRRAVLMPIAMIVTDRRRVELVGTDLTERIEISDDHVSSIVGHAPRTDVPSDRGRGGIARSGVADGRRIERVDRGRRRSDRCVEARDGPGRDPGAGDRCPWFGRGDVDH